MNIKLDENIGRATKRLLRTRGHDVDDVSDENLCGASDESVWDAACREQRFFITLDTDFADARRFQPGTHPGLLLLRPRRNASRATAELVRRVADEHGLSNLRGCLVVARMGSVRILRSPS